MCKTRALTEINYGKPIQNFYLNIDSISEKVFLLVSGNIKYKIPAIKKLITEKEINTVPTLNCLKILGVILTIKN